MSSKEKQSCSCIINNGVYSVQLVGFLYIGGNILIMILASKVNDCIFILYCLTKCLKMSVL